MDIGLPVPTLLKRALLGSNGQCIKANWAIDKYQTQVQHAVEPHINDSSDKELDSIKTLFKDSKCSRCRILLIHFDL